MQCPECYDTSDLVLWREQPLNEEIWKRLDPVCRYANIYHLTLDDALRAWGQHVSADTYPEDTHNVQDT